MAGNVLHFPAATMTVEQAIDEARQQKLSPIVIIGMDSDERVTVVASKMTNERLNWLLDRAKRKLHEE
jgi:hypothetical protein